MVHKDTGNEPIGISSHIGNDGIPIIERLTLWDATTDAQITSALAEQRLCNRLARVQKRVERLRVDSVGTISEEMLTALELALPPRLQKKMRKALD